MKKEFRLYHDSDIFKNMPDGTNLVLENKLIEHTIDEDFDTDEETVDFMKLRCKKELREAIRNFCTFDNPFDLVRNIRDPDNETGILCKLTPSEEPSQSISHSKSISKS